MLIHFLKYLLGHIGVKLLGLISLPIYTYFLTPQEYGTYALFLSYIAIAVIIFTLNIHAAIGRFYYEKKLDIRSFLSTTITLTLSTLFISITIVYLIDQNTLETILNFDFEEYGVYFILLTIFNVFFSMYSQTLIPQKKSTEYSLLVLVKASLVFSIIICFLYLAGNNATSMIKGLFTAELLIFFYTAYKLLYKFKISYNVENTKYIINYSILLMPYALSGIIMAQIDRIMMGEILSTFEVGIYSISYAVSMIPLMLFTALASAWTPYYFQFMDDNNFKKIEEDTIKILYFISFIIFSLILFSNEVVFILLDEKYVDAKKIIPVLSLSVLFIVLWQMWGRSIGYAKKTVWISIIGIMSAFINIFLNYYWIPEFKMYGAVYSTLISYIFMALFAYYIARYYLKVYTVALSSMKIIFFINGFALIVTFIEDPKFLLFLKVLYILSTLYFIFKYKYYLYNKILYTIRKKD